MKVILLLLTFLAANTGTLAYNKKRFESNEGFSDKLIVQDKKGQNEKNGTE